MDHHQPLGILITHRPQQHRVDEAEDGAIGADAERERQHGDGREDRRLQQRAQRMAKIERQRAHVAFSSERDGVAALARALIVGVRHRNRAAQIRQRVLPRRGAAASAQQLDEVGFEIGAEPLAEFARIGAQQQAKQAGRERSLTSRLVRQQPLGAHERGQARQALGFHGAARGGPPAAARTRGGDRRCGPPAP